MSGGAGNKEQLCAHTLTLTHRTRPTPVLSKNDSWSLVAKIKEPLGGQPPEEISLLCLLLFKGLFEISRLVLERIPGCGGGFPQLEMWVMKAQPPWPGRGGGEPRGARLGALAVVAAV